MQMRRRKGEKTAEDKVEYRFGITSDGHIPRCVS
jgi:hypothetical protein